MTIPTTNPVILGEPTNITHLFFPFAVRGESLGRVFVKAELHANHTIIHEAQILRPGATGWTHLPLTDDIESSLLWHIRGDS